MTSPLLNILMQYAGAVTAGIIVGFIFKVYFASQVQKRIKDYQCEIVRSHSRILQLEEVNGLLEKSIKELQKTFSQEQIFMN